MKKVAQTGMTSRKTECKQPKAWHQAVEQPPCVDKQGDEQMKAKATASARPFAGVAAVCHECSAQHDQAKLVTCERRRKNLGQSEMEIRHKPKPRRRNAASSRYHTPFCLRLKSFAEVYASAVLAQYWMTQVHR